LGISASAFIIKFPFFDPSDFPYSFMRNFVPGLVHGGILSFAFWPYTPDTSILHPKIISKIGTS
jgi:hypothetical protein